MGAYTGRGDFDPSRRPARRAYPVRYVSRAGQRCRPKAPGPHVEMGLRGQLTALLGTPLPSGRPHSGRIRRCSSVTMLQHCALLAPRIRLRLGPPVCAPILKGTLKRTSSFPGGIPKANSVKPFLLFLGIVRWLAVALAGHLGRTVKRNASFMVLQSHPLVGGGTQGDIRAPQVNGAAR
jgi:hypothetical protein